MTDRIKLGRLVINPGNILDEGCYIYSPPGVRGFCAGLVVLLVGAVCFAARRCVDRIIFLFYAD